VAVLNFRLSALIVLNLYQKWYYVSSLNKVYEIFVCARAAGDHSSVREKAWNKMQIANCEALAVCTQH